MRKALGSEHLDLFDKLENYFGVLRKIDRENQAAKMKARAKSIRALEQAVGGSRELLLVAALVTSSLLLGWSLVTMLLGHWYLVAPGLASSVADRLGPEINVSDISDTTLCLSCFNGDKMPLIRRIGDLGDLVDDLQIKPPRLDEVYSHFMNRGVS